MPARCPMVWADDRSPVWRAGAGPWRQLRVTVARERAKGSYRPDARSGGRRRAKGSYRPDAQSECGQKAHTGPTPSDVGA